MPLPYCIITIETILSTRSEMLKAKVSYTLNVSRPEGDRATVKIRSEEGEFFPYDFLYGALSACFHSTLVEIWIKSKPHQLRSSSPVKSARKPLRRSNGSIRDYRLW